MYSLIIFSDSKDVAVFAIITSTKFIQRKKTKIFEFLVVQYLKLGLSGQFPKISCCYLTGNIYVVATQY